MKLRFNLIISIFMLVSISAFNQITNVGNGSYTQTFPGVDAAGRNSYPSGTPQISGNAAGKPVPTNDWWSTLIKEDHTNNLFNYPLALRTVNEGLVVSFIEAGSGANESKQPMDDTKPIVVGVSGLNASKATVSDYTDWTVTMAWNDGSHDFYATTGIAMPFIYLTKKTSDVASVNIASGSVVISNEVLIITDAKNGADFAVYAPSGSTWQQNGTVYTSTLNNKNYWSIAYLPPTATSVSQAANEYKKYAYVFPANTTTEWNFNESSSKLTTTFTVTTDVKEGSETNVLLGLLPHQWGYLASSSATPDKYAYSSIRGEIKTLDGNTFSTERTFQGILPTLPYLANYSEGFDPSLLDAKISQIENDGLATWTDSYNEGQVMNRLIQTARIADQMGDTEARDKMIATVKERLEDWLTAENGEVAFLFYYNTDWSALIGYPAGHGQDGNLNDHHFHWGYFIHAAAFMEQYEPGWANQWGDMINLLVRDAASTDRTDTKFPFLRNFSPYAGHCWANGFATFPFGNDQESTSESMQFHSSLIHWGAITGNDEIRDLGIYLYTTEQTAIEEYWFDVNSRTLKPEYNYSMVSRVWCNGYDNQTFWTTDIEAVYGIEMYPIHGGSLYLGQDTNYVRKVWNEITSNTGILTNEANPNLWHDVMWEYLAFIDPEKAIALYDSYPNRTLKFGVSDAQTYHWLHTMNAVGVVNTNITANYPLSTVFTKDGSNTYVAHNYSDSPITVTFSDGYELAVPAKQMATNRSVAVSATLSSDFAFAHANGSVTLTTQIEGSSAGQVSKVEFFNGETLLGSLTTSPYKFKATDLSLGKHNFYAKVYIGTSFNVTNIVSIQVGDQEAYNGTASAIPGTIEAGHYDKYDGGVGQGITYVDVSQNNEGDFRTSEYVDAVSDNSEGATVGWISAGEWLEYTVNVTKAGVYDMVFRYASNNANGGGPFYLELDGVKISNNISVSSTGAWDAWASKTVSGIEMTAGEHILKVVFTSGEFNLGKMTFNFKTDLSYNPPVANAGDDVKIKLPATAGTLDGSASTNADGQSLSYKWEQIYGPSLIQFSDITVVKPNVSNLEAGIYKVKLTVSDGTYSSSSTVLIIVTEDDNLKPAVSITSPSNGSLYYENNSIAFTASATDMDGTIAKVEYFDGANKIGESTTSPYNLTWDNASVGDHIVTAVATDNGGASSTSSAITITVEKAPSCQGSHDGGDYTYLFSDDKSNPTLTFIPGKAGTGSPTCILYLSTSSSGGYAGYGVSPDVPYQITAAEGTTVYFYYTYSYDGMERNTAANPHSYVVGTCGESTPAEEDDATLSGLMLNGGTIAGFSADEYNYTVELPYGTLTIPSITATSNSTNATVNITPATSLPGSTTVLVTAEDGSTQLTYTVNFTYTSPSTDATLSQLLINGNALSNFDASASNYTVELVYGTTLIPVITATSTHDSAIVTINAATTIPDTTSITVTAQDGKTSMVYQVAFVYTKASSDATLSQILVDGNALSNFDASASNYTVELVYGTTLIPVITATSTHDSAIVTINAATTIPDTTSITVTAQDGKTSMVYQVAFVYTEASSDATLSSLSVNNQQLAAFNADTLNYTLELPYGTTTVPIVTAISSHDSAKVNITNAAKVPGTTLITVVAQNDSTSLQYAITFSVAEQISTDATLSDIKVDGATLTNFKADTYTYEIELAYGTTKIPEVIATASNAASKVVISETSSLPGTTNIVVTAQDSITKLKYHIVFNLAKPSSDASLADMKINGVTLENFSDTSYQYTLIVDSSDELPIITAKASHDSAKVVISNAVTLPDTATVTVTAQDDSTTKTYTVIFTTIESLNSDATLSKLLVNESLINGFSPSVYNYSIELPYGSTEIPSVNANANYDSAKVKITQASSLPGVTTILVTAEDDSTQLTYSVAFTLAEPSSEASLRTLLVNGTTVNNFVPTVFTYTIVLPFGTQEIPTIVARAKHESASVSVNEANTIPGTSTVVVLAQDGITELTYHVNFTLEEGTAINEVNTENINVYSHNNYVYLLSNNALINGKLEIIDITGKKIISKVILNNKEVLELNRSGMFIARIYNTNDRIVHSKKLILQ